MAQGTDSFSIVNGILGISTMLPLKENDAYNKHRGQTFNLFTSNASKDLQLR